MSNTDGFRSSKPLNLRLYKQKYLLLFGSQNCKKPHNFDFVFAPENAPNAHSPIRIGTENNIPAQSENRLVWPVKHFVNLSTTTIPRVGNYWPASESSNCDTWHQYG